MTLLEYTERLVHYSVKQTLQIALSICMIVTKVTLMYIYCSKWSTYQQVFFYYQNLLFWGICFVALYGKTNQRDPRIKWDETKETFFLKIIEDGENGQLKKVI